MEDVSNILQTLLGDPKTRERLQGVLAGLTAASDAESAPPPAPAVGAPAVGVPAADTPAADGALLGRILPLLGEMQRENESTTLLRALRPYLHGEREKRLDGAIQMLRLAELLPLLQEGTGASADR